MVRTGAPSDALDLVVAQAVLDDLPLFPCRPRTMLGQKRPVKLNAQRARELRERFAKGTSIKTLAEQYNVSETTVRDVLR